MEKRKWLIESDDAATTASKMIGAGRGNRGFGNARDVRNLVDTAQKRATNRVLSEGRGPGSRSPARPQQIVTLKMEDVLGPRPDPKTSEAIRALDKMIGLTEVKENVRRLMALALSNYEKRRAGQDITNIPLNRLFLGPPGG